MCRLCGGTGVTGDPDRRVTQLPVLRDDMTRFATKDWPLRPSQLAQLVECNWRVAMRYVYGTTDESGSAADTGSAMHAAVAAWHTVAEGDVTASVEAMVARTAEFPLADLSEAAAMFFLYTRDPRNACTVVLQEKGVELVLPPAPEDPTKAPIVVQGTLDQVRCLPDKPEGERFFVFDLKTSKRPGLDLLREHMYQVAAYCVGASRELGEPVHPGSLVCPRHYKKNDPPENRPEGVFFPYPWRFRDTRLILSGLRRIVAAVRAGHVWIRAGDHCRWCDARGPERCLPLLDATVDPRTLQLNPSKAAPPPEWTGGAVDFDMETL